MNVRAAPAVSPPMRERARWWLAPPLALLLTLLMVWVMRLMIRTPQGAGLAEPPSVDAVRVVDIARTPPASLPELAAAAPPPPPAAPPALARADLPAIPAPAVSLTPSNVQIPLGGGTSALGQGLGLGSSGVFGGFAGGLGGSGGGGGAGYARGEGFKGKELIPLSTARPQMPDWACKQKIKGWVTAVFTVMPDGHVQNVRIVDAQPRGVYEAAAIESISHWIYEQSSHPREVLQKVEMDPADCQYNWR
ncbi:MAG: energy transducer TonB [Sinobacteraceae bacterium]|nr:energy transducer TonB [Nevskiaceae bacterium]